VKILLLGAAGQVGKELQTTLAPVGEVVSKSRSDLDLTNLEALVEQVRHHHPQVIVNAAAYTAVDRAETEPELAHLINSQVPRLLAQEAQHLGAYFLHLSTDYVFDGGQNTPYLETAATEPLGVYGHSKLAGELAIQAVGGNFLILRTAWVYGVHGKGNFVKTMLRLGRERSQLKVVVDQIGTPTWARDLAQAIAVLVSQSPTGIYHFTNSGVASWYDFAVAIFTEARALGLPLQVEQVVPITTDAYPTPARRPAYSVLSNAKISAVLGVHPPHWQGALGKMLAQGQVLGIF
jgi:dTDP-4-dehydrorhamnose reductase